jgi:membrane-anchored glycerophosphoryl diester phosphodiesterase (GDPDase)
MVRDGREPKVQDVFSHMRLFFPLVLFGVLVLLATLIGFSLLIIPGMAIVLAVAYCCLYMLPLMTDKGFGLFDAVKESYSITTKGSWIDNLAVFIIFIGVLAIGSAAFIGILFTQPFVTIFLMSVYEVKTGKEEEGIESEESD